MKIEDIQGEFYHNTRKMAEEIIRLRNAIAKHKEQFPDEPLDGELELWETLKGE